MQINDGTGRGNVAKVTSDNQLSVAAASQTHAAHRSVAGETYSSGPTGTGGVVTVTTTGGTMVHLGNGSTTRSVVIDQVTVGSEAADLLYTSYIDADLGVSGFGNDEAGNVFALNTSSSKKTSVTSTVWDGVGDGVTGLTKEAVASRAILGVGASVLDAGGVVVIGPGSGFTVDLKSLGAGTIDATVSVRFYETTL